MAFQPIIYTFGAGEYLNSVFESMSILFNFRYHSAMLWLYRIAGAIGVITIVLKAYAAKGADGSPGAIDWPWFIMFSIIFLVIAVPRTTVRIEDVMKKQTYVVTEAPWALSIFGWFTSNIGYGLTRIYEDSLGGGMNPVEGYSGNGIAFGSAYYNTLTGLSTFSPLYMSNAVDPFVVECLIPSVTGNINPRNSGINKNDLFTSNNLYGLIKRINDNFLKNRYVTVNGDFFSCEELRTKVLHALDHDSLQVLATSGIANMQVISGLDSEYLKQATDNNSNSLKQAMMMNAIYSSVQAQSTRLGDTATSAALYNAQAQFQTISGWRQASVMASTSMVWLHIVAECMIYALWTLCTFLFLLPGGWRGITMYLKLLMWIQLWPIFYSVLNSIIAVYATTKTNALALQYAGLTMSNFYQISDLNGGIVTTAGYISTMIPVMSWMLLQGAGALVSHVAGSFASSGKVAAERAGSEESLGNMQINKVTVKDTNFAGNEVTGKQTSKVMTDGGSYTKQGDTWTAQENKMELMNAFNMVYGVSATSSVALNNAITQQRESATNYSSSIMNMINSAKGDSSVDQHNQNLMKAINVSDTGSSTTSSSDGSSDSNASRDNTSVNLFGDQKILKGIGKGTGAVIGSIIGGAPGAIVGGAMGEKFAEKIGKVLKMDQQWVNEHKNDVATKSAEQIGMEAMSQIAANYSHITGFSQTTSFQNMSQQVNQSGESYKVASGKVDTYSHLVQNQESNSASENETAAIMRNKFNKHIQEGMSLDEAKEQTIADMKEMVHTMPMNEIQAINDSSGRNSNLGGQKFNNYQPDNTVVGKVNQNVPTEEEVNQQYSNVKIKANKANQRRSQKNKNAVKQGSAEKVVTRKPQVHSLHLSLMKTMVVLGQIKTIISIIIKNLKSDNHKN